MTTSRPLPRRLLAVALAIALFAGDPLGLRPAAQAAPALPPSVGNSILFHLQLATDIDTKGNPIGQATTFPVGTQLILGLLGWNYVPAGTELRLRLFQGDKFVYEVAHVVVQAADDQGGNSIGFVFPFYVSSGFPAGDYIVEVAYNSVPDEIVPFTVGDGGTFDEVIGEGGQTGPIPYKSPSEVLVVTRGSVLKQTLGSQYPAVAAAAALVGDFRDLEADGQRRSTPDELATEVQRLLRARPYKYLLILGNDDAVPYFRVENIMADSEAEDLAGWELPSDWIPTDNFYTDMDGDKWGVPDLPVARIPSSDDAELLLVQLGENQPPDGGGFALINQQRKGQAGIVLNSVAELGQVRLQYTPPTTPEQFGNNPDAENARYLYVLLHGIGVLTNAWSGDTVAWFPTSQDKPLESEWLVAPYSQQDGVTVEEDPTSRGVVQIGACYGAWTLDTVQEPVHKTADNNLALHYLKGGTRAYVADTHISYSTVMLPTDTPRGRTGFELLFWKGVTGGMTPIDAFQAAKTGIAAAIDQHIADGNIDAAKITLKTLHYMVYLGRP
ncbi:MAG TPA: C25 family cysteine peptidase [Candidatus Limnocylindrales bacterium]|nr:C25 family cysteine peptidase [Candidatus Limnocylindrales bacterium]